MGQKDAIAKNYMRKPEHFADFFNGYYLLLGIENQTDIHYAMPIRNMLYDALLYNQQVEAAAAANRAKGIAESDGEFLSGMTVRDKLIPIISVIIYWGAKPWDAPVSLKEMLLIADVETDALINDYVCNLFSIIDIKKLPNYHTELRELFAMLSARNDSEELYRLIVGNEAFRRIDRDTAVMMREFANVKLPRKDKEEKYNMCKAITDLEKKNQEIGKEIGADRAFAEAIRNLMDTTKKSFEEACALLRISPDDMNKYRKMI